MKRKAINKDVTNDFAYNHWRNQIKICEAQLLEKFEIEKKLENEILDLNDNLEDDIATLKYICQKEIDLIEIKREENQEIMGNFEEKLKIAKIRCKDPFFENLSMVFPLVILELLVGYNSFEICSECTEAYVPRFSSCWKSEGHQYTCQSSATPKMSKNGECVWDDIDDQSVWDDLMNMLQLKTTIRGQDIETFFAFTEFHKILIMNVVLTADNQSVILRGYCEFGALCNIHFYECKTLE